MIKLLALILILACFAYFNTPSKCPLCGERSTSNDFDVDIHGNVYNDCLFCHKCNKRVS